MKGFVKVGKNVEIIDINPDILKGGKIESKCMINEEDWDKVVVYGVTNGVKRIYNAENK